MTRARSTGVYLVVLAALALPGVLVFLPGAGHPAVAAPVSLVHAVLAQVSVGQVQYEEHCASCHGDRGGGTSQAPSIVGLGPAYYDFMMATGRMPLQTPSQQ